MGEWQPATHAYMIPLVAGKIPETDPKRPTLPTIYKIRIDQLDDFKAMHDRWGTVWYPIYSMDEAMDFDFSNRTEENDEDSG